MLESYARLTPGAFYLFQADSLGRYSLPAISEQVEAILGYSATELSAKPELVFDRMHPDDRKRVQTDIQHSRCNLSMFHCEYRVKHRQGHWVWLAAHSEPEQLDQEYTLWRGFLYDISAQKQAEQQLLQSGKEAKELLNHMMDAVISTDQSGKILSFNRSAQLLLGYRECEAIGQNIALIMPRSHAKRHDSYLEEYQQHQIPKVVGNKRQLEAKHKDGQLIPIELRVSEISDQEGKRFLGVLRDLSAHQQQSKMLQQLQQRDPLTQLPNRQAFLKALAETVRSNLQSPMHHGLVLLDIDAFKQLNDATSHSFCDQVLLELTKRLKQQLGTMQQLARVGGDEFAIIWPLLSADETEVLPTLCEQAEQMLNLLANPIRCQRQGCRLTVSIGICLLSPGMRPDQWLHYAESAVQHAKLRGKNNYQVFTPELARKQRTEARLALDLRDALEQQQLELFLQGQFDQAGQLTGAEALLRWHHPEHGLVPPDTFIPLAEESGLIVPIGRWLVEQAGQLLASWHSNPLSQSLQLAINISSRQFSDPSFVSDLLNCLQRYRFNPNLLHLELTESLLIDNASEVADIMMRLNSQGLTFSLDDFGTGYSSLAYLKRLPLQTLKIDRSFVRDLLNNPNDALIARSIVSLAHNLGLSVIAEGVEEQAQLQALTQMGCGCFQGYYFQRPMPVAEFAARYLQHNARSTA
ncbi:putative bifunctional diguanylate cyclase/phosphodiesterase [Alkalimonas amylolytica]|uniref:Sensor protein FixL n=1 Tax=Alkalimonas amylolytica TaxID=152573 RepID=A0A1H3X268_ALKAM|nr:bifunctional diguanylate cyclase/phosphodiesterase [Alkalimonas amylolytica]SDZ92722.1 PAS domain S-box-containing protein/diguanylate cyclase (GGDEF) domain-containing protein [Alkalimonas amylolytica]